MMNVKKMVQEFNDQQFSKNKEIGLTVHLNIRNEEQDGCLDIGDKVDKILYVFYHNDDKSTY